MVDRDEAKSMRSDGATLAEIADHFGVTRQRIGQILGRTPRAHDCRECGAHLPNNYAIYCSDDCARDAEYQRGLRRCADCGSVSKGERCKSCKRKQWERERHARWDRIEALWGTGKTMAQIAVEIGTSANALGGELVRMRAAGRDLPFRRARTPKSAGLTKEESRAQLTDAIRNGKIRRPTRCEACGVVGLVDAHHHDYSKPFYVTWLCEPCHKAEHGHRRRLAA